MSASAQAKALALFALAIAVAAMIVAGDSPARIGRVIAYGAAVGVLAVGLPALGLLIPRFLLRLIRRR